jgi:hypothetical protein
MDNYKAAGLPAEQVKQKYREVSILEWPVDEWPTELKNTVSFLSE